MSQYPLLFVDSIDDATYHNSRLYIDLMVLKRFFFRFTLYKYKLPKNEKDPEVLDCWPE